MVIKEITVSAGRTFNHPYEAYSNYRPSVTLMATIEEGDNVKTETNLLQELADGLVEENKRKTLVKLDEDHEKHDKIRRLENELESLKDGVPF